MAYEDEIVTRLRADATLMATLTGGVWSSAEIGPDGIRRGTNSPTKTAFDANGYLKPCALVRQRGNVPDGMVRDDVAQVLTATQVVEVYFYQDRGFGAIDQATARVRALLQGHQLTGAFPLQLANVVDRLRDEGALQGASLARQDWAVYNVLG